jgi:hypothetical protein
MGARSVLAVSYGANMRPAITGERVGVYAEGGNANARLVPGVSEVIEEEVFDSAIQEVLPSCKAGKKGGGDCLARPLDGTSTCWFHGER